MKRYIAAVIMILSLLACQSESLTPSWRADTARIAAVKISLPVAAPGETLVLSALLIGPGLGAGQPGAATQLIWQIGNRVIAKPANETATLMLPDIASLNTLLTAEEYALFSARGWVDIFVTVTATMDNATVAAQKLFRIAAGPAYAAYKHANPEIIAMSVEVVPKDENKYQATEGGVMNINEPLPEKIIFTPTIKNEGSSEETVLIQPYRFQWLVSPALDREEAVIEAVAGSTTEKFSIEPVPGVYQICVVLYDEIGEPEGEAIRFGNDFYCFYAAIAANTPALDADIIKTDSVIDADSIL